MSAEILKLQSREEREEAALEKLPPMQAILARLLVHRMPNYRYDLSRLPRLDPSPAPGMMSAIAAAKAVFRLIDGYGGGGSAA